MAYDDYGDESYWRGNVETLPDVSQGYPDVTNGGIEMFTTPGPPTRPNMGNIIPSFPSPIGGAWDWLKGLAPAVVKTLVSMGVVPASVAAALGIIIDVVTPGGLVNLDPGPGLIDVGVTGPGVFSSTLAGVEGKGTPIKSWWTGTAKFYKTNLGWFAAQRKDGTIKWFKPPRNIVISRNPNIRTLVRAETVLSKWAKSVYRVQTRKTKFRSRN